MFCIIVKNSKDKIKNIKEKYIFSLLFHFSKSNDVWFMNHM